MLICVLLTWSCLLVDLLCCIWFADFALIGWHVYFVLIVVTWFVDYFVCLNLICCLVDGICLFVLFRWVGLLLMVLFCILVNYYLGWVCLWWFCFVDCWFMVGLMFDCLLILYLLELLFIDLYSVFVFVFCIVIVFRFALCLGFWFEVSVKLDG